MPHILVATLAYADYIYIHYETCERTRSEKIIFTSVKNQNLFFGEKTAGALAPHSALVYKWSKRIFFHAEAGRKPNKQSNAYAHRRD